MHESPVRAALVSDSLVVRHGLVGLIGLTGGAVVVSQGSSLEGLAECDVVIYDLLSVRDLTAYADVRRLVAAEIHVVGLTAEHQGPLGRVADLGLSTVVSLAVTPAELRVVLGKVSTAKGALEAHERARLPAALTGQELHVLALIGRGLSNQQIADEMFVTKNTVKTYVRTAYRKIGADTRAKAVLWALRHGVAAGAE